MKKGSFRHHGTKGFSLVELLVVLAIIGIMSSLMLSGAMASLKGSQDVTTSAYTISGILEQARTMAMSGNTYTWVGFFEESPSASGTAGTGQVVVAIVSATDGTNLNPTGTAPTALPNGSLMQVAKIFKIPNLHLDQLSSTDVPTRTTVPTTTYQVANSSFANGTTFTYPLTGTPTYTFKQIIQFNPQGDASRIYDTPVPLMEIGLRSAHGSTADASSKNLVAIQVEGIGGKVTVYRP